MPSYVVRQPNGLYAVFSTIVDHFTVTDATADELVGYFEGQMSRDDAQAKVLRGVQDDCTHVCERAADDGLNRWRDALETVRAVHGEAAAKVVEGELSREPR